jgi:hypothetical protein
MKILIKSGKKEDFTNEEIMEHCEERLIILGKDMQPILCLKNTVTIESLSHNNYFTTDVIVFSELRKYCQLPTLVCSSVKNMQERDGSIKFCSSSRRICSTSSPSAVESAAMRSPMLS